MRSGPAAAARPARTTGRAEADRARMLELRLHGRGGQGAQVACQILADAFFRAGAWVQAFAAYGGERRGAPVTAFLRVDDQPIRLRCDITHPDHVIVLDPTLLPDLALDTVAPGGTLLVNAAGPLAIAAPPGLRVIPIDAARIARAHGLGPLVATTMLGAFAGATRLVELGALVAAIEAGSPARTAANVAAAREAAYALGAAGMLA